MTFSTMMMMMIGALAASKVADLEVVETALHKAQAREEVAWVDLEVVEAPETALHKAQAREEVVWVDLEVVEARETALHKAQARVEVASEVHPLVALPVEMMVGSTMMVIMMTGALTMTICMMMMETFTTIGHKDQAHQAVVAPGKEMAVVGGVAVGIL
jgi:hypothetical protein